MCQKPFETRSCHKSENSILNISDSNFKKWFSENEDLQHETSELQQLAPVNQCSPRRRHAEQAHCEGCAAVDQGVAGVEGSEGTLGSHGTAYLCVSAGRVNGTEPLFHNKKI